MDDGQHGFDRLHGMPTQDQPGLPRRVLSPVAHADWWRGAGQAVGGHRRAYPIGRAIGVHYVSDELYCWEDPGSFRNRALIDQGGNFWWE